MLVGSTKMRLNNLWFSPLSPRLPYCHRISAPKLHPTNPQYEARKDDPSLSASIHILDDLGHSIYARGFSEWLHEGTVSLVSVIHLGQTYFQRCGSGIAAMSIWITREDLWRLFWMIERKTLFWEHGVVYASSFRGSVVVDTPYTHS